jgi:quercetin dioxygenase-like cupin family protein
MTTHDWSEVPREQMNALTVRQVIHTPEKTVSRLELQAGSVVNWHSHHNEQVTMLLSGRLRFLFGSAEAATEVIIAAGQVMEIEPHLPHRVETLEEAVAIDVFTPPREDWKRGEDAYLR